MTTWVTMRGIALAVGVLTAPLWLLWAEHLDAGWRTVLATAGLWWLAALQATWRVWLPAAVTLGTLWLALPPRPPRRWDAEEPAGPGPAEGGAEGATGRPASAGQPDPARLWVAELLAFARTPEGAAALEAEREAARAGDGGAPEPEAGSAGETDPAPEPDAEEGEPAEEDGQAEDGDDGADDGDDEAEGEGEGEDVDRDEEGNEEAPKGQDQTQDPPRAVGPASGPAPPRTVWEAFALRDQEGGEDEGDDDAA